MGHTSYSKEYIKLQKRLDKAPQGAPASDSLFRILEHLFSKEEARLVSKLPIRYFTIADAIKIWKKPEDYVISTLNELSDKGIFGDLE